MKKRISNNPLLPRGYPIGWVKHSNINKIRVDKCGMYEDNSKRYRN